MGIGQNSSYRLSGKCKRIISSLKVSEANYRCLETYIHSYVLYDLPYFCVHACVHATPSWPVVRPLLLTCCLPSFSRLPDSIQAPHFPSFSCHQRFGHFFLSSSIDRSFSFLFYHKGGFSHFDFRQYRWRWVVFVSCNKAKSPKMTDSNILNFDQNWSQFTRMLCKNR